MYIRSLSLIVCAVMLVSGCTTSRPAATFNRAALAPPTQISRDLINLPESAGPISVAVYGLRDQTGQYKPSPDSSFSTAVTQGAASLLVTRSEERRGGKSLDLGGRRITPTHNDGRCSYH